MRSWVNMCCTRLLPRDVTSSLDEGGAAAGPASPSAGITHMQMHDQHMPTGGARVGLCVWGGGVACVGAAGDNAQHMECTHRVVSRRRTEVGLGAGRREEQQATREAGQGLNPTLPGCPAAPPSPLTQRGPPPRHAQLPKAGLPPPQSMHSTAGLTALLLRALLRRAAPGLGPFCGHTLLHILLHAAHRLPVQRVLLGRHVLCGLIVCRRVRARKGGGVRVGVRHCASELM